MTAEQQKKFKYWQWRTIAGTMIGYIFFYLIRKNFSFAMPGLTADFGITKATLGGVLSAAGFLYGLSKLINGMLADRINGRWHMVTGLAVSTVTAFVIGYGAEIITALTGVPEGSTPEFVGKFTILLSAMWIVNNIFQGVVSLHALVLFLVGYRLTSSRQRCLSGTPHTLSVQVLQVYFAVCSLWLLWVPICQATLRLCR